jgi:NAD(P)-dependent dehydrogenase (short-subunit alcohol dehydrogenase family)
MKVVVVGASSGLGRCIGTALASRGDSVALLARRLDKLTDAAKDAGPGTLAIACDVIDEQACRAAIDEAAAGLGGIDGLVYAAGVGPLARLVDTDAATWRRTFDTNVIGAATATAAALPHLVASNGVAAYLSSISVSSPTPWPGLGAYISTKAALEKMVEAWRVEHPEVGFTRIAVGDCAGGKGDAMVQFDADWDPALFDELATAWLDRGLLSGALLDVEELVRVVATVLACGARASIPSVAVVPRPPSGAARRAPVSRPSPSQAKSGMTSSANRSTQASPSPGQPHTK